jgi:hypothetical protein
MPQRTSPVYNDSVRASQETHYVSITEPNRLMLFGETVAVYCENHTEHTDTVRTSQETHNASRVAAVLRHMTEETQFCEKRQLRHYAFHGAAHFTC